MAIKFMGKNFPRKVVRQIPNRKFFYILGETVKEEKLEENKEPKTDKEMADEKIYFKYNEENGIFKNK